VSPASSPCIARPATLDDLAEVATLLHHIFGVYQSAALLKWKFTGCMNKLTGSTVLTSNHRIVGFLGQIPERVNRAGHEILATQGADIGILEEYRRLDVFLTLIQTSVLELKKAGVALTYGTTNEDATLTLSSLLGQQPVAAIPLLVRPLKRAASPSSRPGVATLTQLLAACLYSVDRGAGWNRESFRDSLRVIRVERFDERFDRFWQRIRTDYPMSVVRDAETLNWRYVNAPGIVYERLGIENAMTGEIEGYSVLGMTRRDHRMRGRICDLVTPRRDKRRAAHALVAASVRWLSAQQADLADVWMFPHAHLRVVLRLHGFIPWQTGHRGFQVSVMTPGATPERPGAECANNWFLSLGDSDTV